MKIVDKTPKVNKKDMYAVGNMIKNEGFVFLVIYSRVDNDENPYKLLRLDTNEIINSGGTIDELANSCYSSEDTLVNGKLVIERRNELNE